MKHNAFNWPNILANETTSDITGLISELMVFGTTFSSLFGIGFAKILESVLSSEMGLRFSSRLSLSLFSWRYDAAPLANRKNFGFEDVVDVTEYNYWY